MTSVKDRLKKAVLAVLSDYDEDSEKESVGESAPAADPYRGTPKEIVEAAGVEPSTLALALADLGVDIPEGRSPDEAAIIALQEAKTYSLELAEKLEIKQRTVDSLQKSLIQRQEDMEGFVAMGADDQLFYLTEFMQQRFSHDFSEHNTDVITMAKKLLLELQERRAGKLHHVTKEKFLWALKRALASLELDYSMLDKKSKLSLVEGTGDDERVTARLISWNLEIRERVKKALGLRDADDMRVDWLVGEEEQLGIISRNAGGDLFYGRKTQ